MKWSFFQFVTMLIIVFLVSSCGIEESENNFVDEVSLQMTWKHQAQFAGFYAAEENGFYEEENIKINFLQRTTLSFDVIQAVVKGNADFGITYGIGVLDGRSRRLPIVAVAAIFKRYPLSFISLKENGITSPIDFSGKIFRTLTPGGTSVSLDLLLGKHGLDKDDIDIRFLDVGYAIERFYSGEIDVWAGYTINESLHASQKGYEVNEIRLEDFGVDMMGDTLFVAEIVLNTNPDLVQRFVRATLRGWQWAVEHPEAAGKLALLYDPGLDSSHQIAMMHASIPYIQRYGKIGFMEGEVWQGMYRSILELGIINKPVNLNSVYTNRFVEEFYTEKSNRN